MDYEAPERVYGDVKSLYVTKHVRKLPEATRPVHKESIWMARYRKSEFYVELPIPDWDGTSPNEKNVWKSLSKMWEKPKLDLNQTWWARAKRIVKRKLRPFLACGLEYEPTWNLPTVPGCWWQQFGFKTKEEVMASPLFYQSCDDCRKGKTPYPPFKAAPKIELLKNSELLEDKIRTFLMASMELLNDEKWLYGKQDKNLKKFQPGWIKYGISFHKGGMDRLVKKMLELSVLFFEWDVKGWDRLLAVLKEVQEIRNELLKESLPVDIWDLVEPVTKRVSKMIIEHPLLLPDGSVVSWPWSQMSGDGETTPNNCIAHDLISTYLLIAACPSASDETIIEQSLNLYGDDQFGGVTKLFSKLGSQDFVNSIYQQFGLSLKPGTFKCDESPLGHTFLGATVRSVEHEGDIYFLPSYDKNRILSGLQMAPMDRRLHDDDELCKAFSLLELGWFDCYDEIVSYIKYLLLHLPESDVKRSYINKGIPSREEIILDWIGALSA